MVLMVFPMGYDSLGCHILSHMGYHMCSHMGSQKGSFMGSQKGSFMGSHKGSFMGSHKGFHMGSHMGTYMGCPHCLMCHIGCHFNEVEGFIRDSWGCWLWGVGGGAAPLPVLLGVCG